MPKLPVISGSKLITNDLVFITIPLHRELDKGTLIAILKDAHISREEFFEYL